MNALGQEIAQMIAQEGPISFERYMALALSHPQHGYYMSKIPIGATGDFITAPEVHQMFGELIGLWVATTWRAMGEPSRVHLIELGPGRGTLMADLLRAAQVLPAFRAALVVHLVETSPVLEAEQARTLADCGLTIVWHKNLEELAAGPSLIIANEFFDALPVRHYLHDQQGWRERLVGLDADGRLSFGFAPETEPRLTAPGQPGDILEIGFTAQAFMRDLAGRVALCGGALLAFDYGYVSSASGETLQAVKRHAYADPLSDPGEADLTTHVDFAALAHVARTTGAAVHGPVTQGEWLVRLGILERAKALRQGADEKQAAAIDAALTRLAGPGPTSGPDASMAQLFKVLAVTPFNAPIPAGFETGPT